jgi:hypothetical protein
MTKQICWSLALGIALSLAGCATSTTQRAILDDFANRATRGPLYVYWDCSKQAPGLLQVEGVAVQPHYPAPVQDLKFRLEGVDGRGNVVSKGEATAQDYMMHQMEQNPFRLVVRTVGTEARYNLTYTYLLHISAGGNAADADSPEHEYVAKNVCPAR